jgi:hypothetical protein
LTELRDDLSVSATMEELTAREFDKPDLANEFTGECFEKEL